MGTIVAFRDKGQFSTDKTRRDEARIEALAQLDEVEDFVVTAVPVVREWLGNLVKLGERNRAAREEVMSLGGPDAA